MSCNLFGCAPQTTTASCRVNPNTVNICFRVIDENDCPLCGAVYRLCCNCGQFINAISGKNGCITFFGICPGEYELTQIAEPYGYLIDKDIHIVTVTNEGVIRTDNKPQRCFNAYNPRIPDPEPEPIDAPTISQAYDDETVIRGFGEPGCKVEVYFPDDAGCAVACVLRDRTWSVNVPIDCTLQEGDEICAVQVCDCMPKSKTSAPMLVDFAANRPRP